MSNQAARLKSPKLYRIATTIFFFISGFGYSSWASRIPSIQQQLQLNEARLGAVLFAMPIGLMATMPFTSYLLGRVNTRKVVLAGAIAYNVVLALVGLAVHTWQLVLILFFFGSSRNLLNLSLNAQAVGVQKMYPESIMTSFHAVWSVAGFAGAAFGYLMVKNNVATSYHLFAVSLVLLIAVIYFHSDIPQQQPSVQQAKNKVFALPDKRLMKFAIICFCCMSCENTMYDWTAIYFQKAVHAPTSTATGAFVVYMVCMTLGRFAGDRLVNAWGIKTLLRYSGWLIFTGLGLAVAFPRPVPAGIGCALVGFGVSCIVPLVFSLAGKSKNMSSGQALASISTIGYLGFLMVPPLVGFIAQAFNLRLSFAIIALLGGIIVVMVSRIKEGE